jgi:biopolymer transport protein ExbB/TolQ
MTDSGTLFSSLLSSLWSDNTLVGRLIILCILFLLANATIATRRNLRRYRSEGANLDRVIARLGQWRAAREAAAAQATDSPAGAQAAAADVDAVHAAAGDTADPAAAGAGKPGAASIAPAPPDAPDAEGATAATTATTEIKAVAPAWHSLTRQQDYGTADIESLQEGVDRSSLIAERLDAIAKMRRFQVKINLGTLQQLTQAKEAARRGMTAPGFAASTAMMLGLLGTFIGLAVMAQRIYFALPGTAAGTTPDSWSSAFQNVTAVLAGIKIAFSTSLVGIFCAVSASLLGHRLRSAQAAFFERLERFTCEDLLPATVPSVEDESLLERVTVQLENSFLRLDDVFRQNADALKEMTGAQRAFVEIVDEIRLVTKNEASRNLEGVVEQVAATNRAVLKLVEQIPRLATAIDNGQRRLVDQLALHGTAASPGAPARSSAAAAWAILAAVVAVLVALRLFSH